MHAATWVVESVLYESEIHFYSLRSKTHKGDKGSRGFVWKLQYTQRLKDFHKVPCPICTPGYHVELRKRGKLLHTKGKISGKCLPQTSPRFYTRILRGCQLWQCTSQWWSQTVECGHTSQTASYYDWGNLCHMVATNNACSNTGRYKFSKYELQKPTYFQIPLFSRFLIFRKKEKGW